MKQNGSILGSIAFAEIVPSTSKGKPNGSVRANGTIVFNDAANEIVGVTGDKNTFKVGSDESGKLYLVPAASGEANTVKATKNGESFMFKQAEVFAGLGAKAKTKYSVSKETDGEGDAVVEYYVLTPSAEKVATDAKGEVIAD